MLEHVKARGLPTILCTLYRPNFENPVQINLSQPGLLAINSIIISAAMKVDFILNKYPFVTCIFVSLVVL